MRLHGRATGREQLTETSRKPRRYRGRLSGTEMRFALRARFGNGRERLYALSVQAASRMSLDDRMQEEMYLRLQNQQARLSRES